ncbi:MAG: YwaF family protein [Clostridia bacterium]|nr:YwaF family protein [Clostridia bacterium]MBR2721158.1 YwaF family protein [Clostridia bacterium]
MFSAQHFIWMGLCALFVIGMTLAAVKGRWSLKATGLVMTAICVFSEVSKIMSDMEASPVTEGMVLNPKSLPFHLCSLLLFAVLLITFGKDGAFKQALMNFMAFAGTVGSLCAILIPTNGTDFASLGAYQCFVYHAGLMWFSVYLIATGRARLGIKAYGQNTLVLLSLAVAMLYVNSALSSYGTNFMYLVRPPMENLPILNLDHGWYVYFLTLLGIGAAALTLFHLPFILIEGHKRTDKGR